VFDTALKMIQDSFFKIEFCCLL